MKDFDIIIIGAATSGAYFAKRMATLGYKVKVIEKSSYENIGNKMDIFHIERCEFDRFNLPEVGEGDPAYAFSFTENHFSSPTNKYIIDTKSDIVGLHMHEYVKLMNDEAKTAGAELEYDAQFSEFTFENGKISGIKYKTADGIKELSSKIVIDCSGAAAVARCALPENYGMEIFKLTPDDLFHVVLRYADFGREMINNFWLSNKSWHAPFSLNNCEKIIGTGATGSYAKAFESAEKLDKALGFDFKVIKTETGVTPYKRPPYTLVADNFIAAGDSACLTKPDCGEGVTSSLVMIDIAVKVLDCAFKKNDFSKAGLWDINTEYNKVQGAEFSLVRAFLTKVVNSIKDEEIEYCFSKGLVFNEIFLNGEKAGLNDIISTVTGILAALGSKNISKNTLNSAIKGAYLGLTLYKHYLNFPKTPDGFSAWCDKSDKLWQKVGKVL